jgi:hypothetical protein
MNDDQMPRTAALRSIVHYYRLLAVWCVEDGQIEQSRAYTQEADRLHGLLTLGIVPAELAD